eukprot:c25194_g1_i1 orf=200-727(+)
MDSHAPSAAGRRISGAAARSRPGESRPTSSDSPGRGSGAGAGNPENGVPERLGGDSPYRSPGRNHGRARSRLGSASPAWEKRAASGVAHGKSRPPDKGHPLPKFGDWDVNNPSSGEHFTVIFDKARIEKKAGSAVPIPIIPVDSSASDIHKHPPLVHESSCSRWFCFRFHPDSRK